MKITNIEKYGREHLIFLDGEFAFKVQEQALFRLELFEGREIDIKELAWLKYQAQLSYAKSAAVRFVSRKLRTVHEVRKKLQEEFEPGVVEEVLSFMEESGYIDDGLYAEKYITERKRLSNFSVKAVEHYLREKGISKDIIKDRLKQMGYDERDGARRLLEKRLKGAGKVNWLKEKGYLFKKGFSFEAIDEVIKEYEGGE